MKCLARYCYLFVLLFSLASRTAGDDIPYCSLEEKEDKYLFIENEWLEHASYKNIKKALIEAQENNNIPLLLALYWVSKYKQHIKTGDAVLSGGCSAYFIALAPLTFGITLIGGIPTAILCGYSSVKAHKVRKLKRKAKEALDFLIPTELFLQIIKAQNLNEINMVWHEVQQSLPINNQADKIFLDKLISKLSGL